ncbi:HlyD family secretion protein [Tumidithrix elongata RA019]|uniref:HlyD family secretion protein n=1 Tax=Tumidithrix elongata BACA0141 TaxID=2716417 RepID=A0AAW9PTA1_9CYAN|nr:HlyD family secretion protein [Tumidithrix elongata RA019]
MKRTQAPDLDIEAKPDRLLISKNQKTSELTEVETAIPQSEVLPDITSDAEKDRDADDTTHSKSRFLNRRNLFWIAGAIALGISSIGGWRWWQFQQTHIITENAQIQGHLSPISCKISATVQQVLVKDGDYVKAGQPMIILENQDLTLNLQQAQAKLQAAKAQVQSAIDTVQLTSQTHSTQVQQAQAQLVVSQSSIRAAQANVNQAEAAIAANQAKVAQAQTEVNKAQADFRRYTDLYQGGAVSAQQTESVKAAYENARANLAAANRIVEQAQAERSNAQAQLQKAEAEAEVTKGQAAETDVAGQNVVVQQDQKQIAQAQVAQANADIALAQQQLEYTIIKAPVSGYVGKLTAQVGQKVQPGQALMSVVPLQTEQVYVEANFKETALQHLRLGQTAEIEVDAYPGEVFRATVAGISPATGASFALLPPDNATGNYNKVIQWLPVRLAFRPDADPQHKLRAGLSVKVTVDAETSADTTKTDR